MPAPNQRLGEYILIDRIGAGTFGQVWRARHHAWADQIVAIKIPTDERFVHYLQKEGAAIGRLVHPTIVKAIAFDPYNDPPYLVMEFVPGPNLRQLIQKGPIPVPDAVAILKQVLAALHQAHAHGIIHRDIKPENILIDQRQAKSNYNKPGTVKLSDFGLGSAEPQNPNSIVFSTDRRDSPQIVGSAPYMSPEQREGGKLDARSDLYSCGIVLFEMLTAQRPAGAESPSEFNPKVPKEIDEVFRRAYCRLDRRFASAEEFFNALKSVQDGRKPIPKPKRRLEKKLVWLASVVGIVLVSLIWILPPIYGHKSGTFAGAPAPGDAALAAHLPVLPGIPPPPRYATQTPSRDSVQDLPSTLAIRLVEINPGTFQMGSLASETGRYDNETRHKVTLTKPYELGQTLITQAQWQAVMGSNPSHFRGDNLPVEQVSNGDAIAFCNKLNEISGRHYRLPTEAEWEYACRAGTTTQFNTGDGEKAMAEAGWYLGNSKDTTHAVGQKKPNVWGLYDMHGDVCEWCSDWYGDYPSGDATDPHGPDYGTSRVLRGGSLASNPAENCRSAYRTNAPADLRRGDIGFRVARDLD